jgi:hypothetical protein
MQLDFSTSFMSAFSDISSKDLIIFTTAKKYSGAGFYLLKNQIVKLIFNPETNKINYSLSDNSDFHPLPRRIKFQKIIAFMRVI